jgi:hypothetical protein
VSRIRNLTSFLGALLSAEAGACSTDHAVVAVLDSRGEGAGGSGAGSGGSAGTPERAGTAGCAGRDACDASGGASSGGSSGASSGQSGEAAISNSGGAASSDTGGTAGASELNGGAIFILGGFSGGTRIETGGNDSGSAERQTFCTCNDGEQIRVCDISGQTHDSFCIGDCQVLCFYECPCGTTPAPSATAVWFPRECLERMQCGDSYLCFDQTPGAEEPAPLVRCSP